MKPPLLFLCHRIPYPPNKGDKIRSWQLLCYLAQHYRVYLGTFVDDSADWMHRDVLEAICEECCILPLRKPLAYLRSLRAFFQGEPLTVPFYYSSAMDRWVGEAVERPDMQTMVVYSSSMAQYLSGERLQNARKMIDFVDVDSDKWLQYAENKRGLMRWLYRREGMELHRFEQRLVTDFDISFFVSEAEAGLFRKMVPEASEKIEFFKNGVDTVYFDPGQAFDSPYPDDTRILVFTGAMDYWPNVDAVAWFAHEVFTAIRREHPTAHFYIVGSNPSGQVRNLASIEGVTVTGTVEDIRPYVIHATAAVAPLRVARGVQNKVLEAMALARPVLVSSMGLEGIEAEDEVQVLVADETGAYVRRFGELVSGQHPGLGSAGRKLVLNQFSWQSSLPKVMEYLRPESLS